MADEWKKKYFEISVSLEKQKEYEELLELSLNRLALACRGISKELDKNLDKLRKLLRSHDQDLDGIKATLTELEKIISKMDHKTNEDAPVQGDLTELLQKVTWPSELDKAALALRKKIRNTSSGISSDIVDEFCSLIEQSFEKNKANTQVSIFRRLFGKFREDLTSHQQPSKKEIHEVLLNLIERLSPPKEVSEIADEIRVKIQRGFELSDLPIVVNEIATLVDQMSALSINDKKDYQNFLLDIINKITALDTKLIEFGKDEITAFNERQLLGSNVNQEMVGLKFDVDKATEIEQLRKTLNSRVSNLNKYISKARRSDELRYRKSQDQIKELNQQLKTMEAEAEELRETSKKAQELAARDPLTGLWNRQALDDTLEREYANWQRNHKSLSIVIWDIDHFKKINDMYGHSAGDVVLKAITEVLVKSYRKADFVARYGGEEFIVLLQGTNLENALALSNKVRQEIEEKKFIFRDVTVPVTASAGVASFEDDDEIENVFNRADNALYKAKSNGRNNCVSE